MLQATHNRLLGLLPILLTVALKAYTPFFIKMGAIQLSDFSLLGLLQNPWYLGALAAFAGRVLAWQWTLARFPLSFAYPFNGIHFITVLCLGVFVFDEALSSQQVAGAALILAGLVLMATTRPRPAHQPPPTHDAAHDKL